MKSQLNSLVKATMDFTSSWDSNILFPWKLHKPVHYNYTNSPMQYIRYIYRCLNGMDEIACESMITRDKSEAFEPCILASFILAIILFSTVCVKNPTITILNECISFPNLKNNSFYCPFPPISRKTIQVSCALNECFTSLVCNNTFTF